MTDTTAHPHQEFQPPPRRKRRWGWWLGGAFAALIAALILLVVFFDWNWLRGPLAHYASGVMERRVEITGPLRVRLFTATPQVSIDGIHISQPDWVGKGDTAYIDRLVVRARWRDLIFGHIELPLLQFDKPVLDLRRTADGRNNWTFGRPSAKPAKLPPIEHFVVDGGQLHLADAQRKLTVDGRIDSDETTGGPTNHAFSLVGDGAMNHRPFSVTAEGAPLINVRQDQPYAFSADVRMAQTHVVVQGRLQRPFDLSAYNAQFRANGPNLADIYYLTGVALPNTPTYSLQGGLRHWDKQYEIKGLSGRLGSSDIAGVIDVSKETARPYLTATLHSHSLDFADLPALIGGAPAGKSAGTANAEQKAQAAALKSQDRVLPDTPLHFERMREMDARLDYTADTVKDTVLPLRGAKLHLTLDHGLLVMDPLDFDLPQGQFNSRISIDGRNATPVTSIDARLSRARIESFLTHTAGPPPIEGMIVARMKLAGRGDSVRQAAAHSNGAVTLAVPHGQIRKAFAELMGVNAGKGLMLLLSKNKDQSDIRCGVAAFDVTNGQLNARDILFDTDVVRVSGTGGANLGDETLNLTFKGDTKRFRFTHVFLPITYTGHFRDPKIGVQPGPAVAQGAVAVALGALLTPLAAILPFIDPGLAKDADCQALMAEAKTSPAPVKGALPTTPPKKK